MRCFYIPSNISLHDSFFSCYTLIGLLLPLMVQRKMQDPIPRWLMLTTISKKLTDEEQLFKTIYLAHPDLHLDEWLPTPEQMAVIQDLPEIQQIYPQISPFFSNDNSFNEQIIPPNRDVHLMIHGRFFPCGIHSHDFFEITYVLKGTCTNYIAGRKFAKKLVTFAFSLRTRRMPSKYFRTRQS